MDNICHDCSKTFTRSPSSLRSKYIFCSRQCRARWVARKRRRDVIASKPRRHTPPGCEWKYLPLSRGIFAKVDSSDYDRLMEYSWSCERGYGRRTSSGRSYYLHREVLGAPVDKLVDHINGDRLDNRRSNLRLCDTSQNLMNTDRRSDNTSGFKGVYFNKQRQKWQAYISANGARWHFGFYEDIEEAVSARLFAECEHFGEFVRA